MTPQAMQYVSTVFREAGLADLATAAIAAEVKYAQDGPGWKIFLQGVEGGKYRLVAARVGGMFYPAEYGQHDARQRGLTFRFAKARPRKIQLEMMQTGSIAGRGWSDENGEPMGHILIMALESSTGKEKIPEHDPVRGHR